MVLDSRGRLEGLERRGLLALLLLVALARLFAVFIDLGYDRVLCFGVQPGPWISPFSAF